MFASGWYKLATETLQRYQAESINIEDEAIRTAERAMYIEELAKELKDIEDADRGSSPSGLLRYLYVAYPPKGLECTLESTGLLTEQCNMKKVLLKAIQHYHPDKQDEEAHGRKWKILCEEITKRLNKYYETWKFESTV